MKRKDFRYTKADGSSTDRSVVVVHEPTDLMLALDVTEFDEFDKNYILDELNGIQAGYMENIRQLGLGKLWRTFKQEGIRE